MGIKDKVIVFTGKISKPRHEFEELVVTNGGIFGTSVTKNTSYLVVGEKPGSKLDVAIVLDIPRLTEEEFLALLKTEDTDEEPLTPEELVELRFHTVERICEWCGSAYKQFDTVPNYKTCSICEILAKPRCPKCGSNEESLVYQTDILTYACGICHLWFRAPHSEGTYYTDHIPIIQNDKCVICKRKHTKNYKIHPGKALLNKQEEQKVFERQELIRDSEQEQHIREWLNSLTEEQIDQVRLQLLEGDENANRVERSGEN